MGMEAMPPRREESEEITLGQKPNRLTQVPSET